MDPGTLDLFEAELRQAVPDLRIKFKDESWVQKLVGAVLYPFNPGYLKDYTTTFGSTVYFPSREFYRKNPLGSLIVLAHEFVHISDSQTDKLFRVKYMLPQGYAVLPLLLYGVLAWSHAWLLALPVAGYVLGSFACRKSKAAFLVAVAAGLGSLLFFGWLLTGWKLLVMLGLVAVAPWPSSGRTGYELRGYGMTVAVIQWISGRVRKETLSGMADEFVGPGYFYMSRDRAYIERTLEATRQQAEAGALQGISPYSTVYDFLYRHGMVLRK